jgi:selenocysteine-specific elongation factor
MAYIGSGEFPARVSILGGTQIQPGATGMVRVRLRTAIPLLPGDRYVLRESGRDETVGGGQILDVEPVLRPSLASPDLRWQRVVAERGWITADHLELLTGQRVPAGVGPWVVDAVARAQLTAALVDRAKAAGPNGLSIASLDQRERAVAELVDELVIDGDVVRHGAAIDPLLDHPVVEELRSGGFTPEVPSADRDTLRRLRLRGALVERDNI